MSQGRYIVIEGHDGTGKSTQVALLREYLMQRGIESIEFHEPEGTPIASEIRTIIKNGTLERSATTNLLLFTAARHEIWHNKAKTALANGTWVISARNYYSTLAYQGYGEGVDIDLITTTTKTFTDEHYIHPDLAVILSLESNEERMKRIGNRGVLENPDTFESRDDDFQVRVRDGYLGIAKEYNLPVISAVQSPEDVLAAIVAEIDRQSLLAS